MKKYILTLVVFATFWSCQTDEQYENLNRDPKNPTDVSADFLFTASTKFLSDQMANPNVNLNIFRFISQYWTATTYLDEPNYNLTERNIPQNHWQVLYRNVLFNLADAKTRVQNDENLSAAEIQARVNQIEVLEVYTWQILVDTFGDIPYEEALTGREDITPTYADAATIYEDLIDRISQLEFDGTTGFTSADVIYSGNMANWEKLANSVQLRLGMRLADVNPSLAQQTVEDAYSGGVLESNADNALFPYEANPPNTNPLWEDLVQSGRSDYVVANTITDITNALEDPRRMEYFDTNLDEYVGGIYGATSSYQNYTHVGPRFREPTNPGILMDFVEVSFLLSDAASNGFDVGGSAEEHYNIAITASINYWGGTDDEAEAYLSQSAVSYDGTEEQFGTQFWLAMYDNPFQGWNVWRTYNAPEFNLPANTGNPVPLRYTYPVNEQNLNAENYGSASEAIGGDTQTTALFWDVQ